MARFTYGEEIVSPMRMTLAKSSSVDSLCDRAPCGTRSVRRQSGGRRGGFSFVELLVVIGIVVILFSILIPYVARFREADRRVRCAANLSAIGVAILDYQRHNGGRYPQVAADPKRPTGFTAFTGAASPNPFGPGSTVAPNDVTASLWLLVRGAPARTVHLPQHRRQPRPTTQCRPLGAAAATLELLGPAEPELFLLFAVLGGAEFPVEL